MKRIYVSLLFVTIASVIAAIEFGYVCAKVDNFSGLIDQTDSMMYRYEYDSASDLCEEIEEKWYKSASCFDIVLLHDYVDDIGQCIAKMRAYANVNNADMYFAESSQAKKKLASIKQSEFPTIENIL